MKRYVCAVIVILGVVGVAATAGWAIERDAIETRARALADQLEKNPGMLNDVKRETQEKQAVERLQPQSEKSAGEAKATAGEAKSAAVETKATASEAKSAAVEAKSVKAEAKSAAVEAKSVKAEAKSAAVEAKSAVKQDTAANRKTTPLPKAPAKKK